MTTRLDCGCRPWTVGGTGRYAVYRHQRDCPEKANQALSGAELQSWRDANRAELQEAMGTHPARGTKRPLRLVEDEGYISEHSDDERDHDMGLA